MTTNLLTSASSTRHHHAAARFGDSDTQEIQERAATALVTKGMALAKLGDYAAAIAAFDEVIARFGGGNVPEMLEWVVSWAWGARAQRKKSLAIMYSSIWTVYQTAIGRYHRKPAGCRRAPERTVDAIGGYRSSPCP